MSTQSVDPNLEWRISFWMWSTKGRVHQGACKDCIHQNGLIETTEWLTDMCLLNMVLLIFGKCKGKFNKILVSFNIIALTFSQLFINYCCHMDCYFLILYAGTKQTSSVLLNTVGRIWTLHVTSSRTGRPLDPVIPSLFQFNTKQSSYC